LGDPNNIIAHVAKLAPELQKHHIFNLGWTIYYNDFISISRILTRQHENWFISNKGFGTGAHYGLLN
jgi:hypothetical protein